MLERSSREARNAIQRARDLAQARGDDQVEAFHLLLALSADSTGPVGRALSGLGLSTSVVRDAVDRERATALAAVGVQEAFPPRDLLPNPRRSVPRWGESAKLAIKRAQKEATSRSARTIGHEHLLLGDC
mgnify:CR=1 FL=1|jgi:ATP-dependent Clp protease ATP-binding subunit ClpA